MIIDFAGIPLDVAKVGYRLVVLFFFGVVLINILKKIAPMIGYIDAPNSLLKSHKKVTPYLGGAGIIGTILAGLLIYSVQIPSIKIYFLLGCLFVLFATGLIDDKYHLSVKLRLAIHVFVAALTVSVGHMIRPTGIPSVDYFISFVGIIAMINAFNILDIMDGLAGGIAFIVLATLGYMIYHNGGNPFYLWLIGFTLTGLFAFLLFNFNPASIFMGDAGSTALGYLITVIFIHTYRNSLSSSGEIASLVAISVPVFELTFVTIIRMLKGLNPLKGSKDHFPIRIKTMGLSIRKTVVIVYLLTLTVGLTSLLILKFNSIYSFVGLAFVILLYLVIGLKLSKIKVG